MKHAAILFMITALTVLVSCKPTVPSQYIQPSDMEDILYDYHIGQAMANQDDGKYEEREYLRLAYLAAILEKHGVTRAEFDSSLVYYYTRADNFEGIYKRVAERLSDKALDLGASQSDVNRYATLTATGDTANVWSFRRDMVLSPYPPQNRFDFELSCDTTYKKGDSFQLNFIVDFLMQSGSKDAVANLSVQFANDSVVTQTNHISVSGVSQLRISSVHGQRPKVVRGFFYMGKGNDKESTVLKLMFINSIQLVRFHSQDEADQDDAEEEKPVEKTDIKKDSLVVSDSLKRDTSNVTRKDTTASQKKLFPLLPKGKRKRETRQ